MGVVKGIGSDTFPRQGEYLNRQTRVCFNYEARNLNGTIVRDDIEEPFLTIIRLEDGRHVLTTECQYAPAADGAPADTIGASALSSPPSVKSEPRRYSKRCAVSQSSCATRTASSQSNARRGRSSMRCPSASSAPSRRRGRS